MWCIMFPDGDTYEAAGVHLGAAETLVDLLRARVRSRRPEVVGEIGGFYGAFRLPDGTVLTAGADGVGTKVLVARALDRWDTVGIDVVAMNVNDILTGGAEPLFFLDYLATGRLDPERAAAVVAAMDRACQEAGCALLGGETAEMPGVYEDGVMDLAGFAVGRVIPDRVEPPVVEPGQRIVGLASAGVHANGFSLVRRILSATGTRLYDRVPGTDASYGEVLLTPTRIYVRPVLDVIRRWPVAAMAHITGGGLVGNLPRVLGGRGARIRRTWPVPPVFSAIQRLGQVSDAEMMRVFNLGIGFCLVVAPDVVAEVVGFLGAHALEAYDIGEVTDRPGVTVE
jgi:phosphoribosylformylglycinamidine cyclo-ligase